MKHLKSIFPFLLLIVTCHVSSQIGIGVATPSSSSLIEAESTEKGILFPRLTTEQREGIVNPAEGLQLYDTTLNCLMLYSDSNWNCFPRNEVMTSGVIAIIRFDPIENAGTQATSTGLNFWYNPDEIVESGSAAGRLRFTRPGVYEVSIFGTVNKPTGGNTFHALGLYSVSDSDKSVDGIIDIPGAAPGHNTTFVKNVIEIIENEEFNLRYDKLAEITAGSLHNIIDITVTVRIIQ